MSEDQKFALQQFQHWLGESGLYMPLRIDSAASRALAIAMDAKGFNVDCYCPGCSDQTVYRWFTTKKLLPPAPMMSGSAGTYNRIESFLRDNLTEMTLRCARDGNHILRVIFSLIKDGDDGYSVTKIGQLPSKFDLVSADLRKYAKVAPEDARELNSAAICASAGFHVAAFVYLRRVFERRLEIAHEATKKDDGWDESAYDPKNIRMEDRISMLRDHLPEFLVENRKIYSLLSKGVHELTEDECAEAYKTLEVGITLILDEEIERKRKAAKLAAVSNDLAKLQQKHNS